MESSNASHPNLDARHLAAQLPPGFPRGDEAAIDAVMQLAAFTEQQQHHQQQPPPAPEQHQEGEEVEGRQEQQPHDHDDHRVGSKRRPSSAGDRSSLAKAQRESESHEVANQQNWASFTGQSNEFEHLLQPNDGSGQEGQPPLNQQEADARAEAEALTRHGRPLSTTKRAAQNRAAQRAFRERRDQHVKEIEVKAKQVDEALASAAMHKQRYEELLKTIAGLRADNQSLRLAINALGGNAPPPPPPVSSANLFSTEGQEGETGSNWKKAPHSFQPDDGHEQQEGEGVRYDQQEKGDSHLDGLSAVAAAAAAAAAAAHAADEDDDKKGGDGSEMERQEGKESEVK